MPHPFPTTLSVPVQTRILPPVKSPAQQQMQVENAKRNENAAVHRLAKAAFKLDPDDPIGTTKTVTAGELRHAIRAAYKLGKAAA